MLLHGYYPCDMSKATICPILKDKNKSTSDKNNYRGIALTSSMCKV